MRLLVLRLGSQESFRLIQAMRVPETFDRDLALSMVANDHEALEEIEDAIDRIFAGTYGIVWRLKSPLIKTA